MPILGKNMVKSDSKGIFFDRILPKRNAKEVSDVTSRYWKQGS